MTKGIRSDIMRRLSPERGGRERSLKIEQRESTKQERKRKNYSKIPLKTEEKENSEKPRINSEKVITDI